MSRLLRRLVFSLVPVLAVLGAVVGSVRVASADAGANGCNTYYRILPPFGYACAPSECVCPANPADACVLTGGPMGTSACNCCEVSNAQKCALDAYIDLAHGGGWTFKCYRYLCTAPQCNDQLRQHPTLGYVISCECP